MSIAGGEDKGGGRSKEGGSGEGLRWSVEGEKH